MEMENAMIVATIAIVTSGFHLVHNEEGNTINRTITVLQVSLIRCRP